MRTLSGSRELLTFSCLLHCRHINPELQHLPDKLTPASLANPSQQRHYFLCGREILIIDPTAAQVVEPIAVLTLNFCGMSTDTTFSTIRSERSSCCLTLGMRCCVTFHTAVIGCIFGTLLFSLSLTLRRLLGRVLRWGCFVILVIHY